MFDRAAEIDEIKHGIANHQLKKPSDLKGGILKERYHIPEGYDKLLQKIENARAFYEKSVKKNGREQMGTEGYGGGHCKNVYA